MQTEDRNQPLKTDSELIAHAIQGDSASVGQLFDRHRDRIKRMISLRMDRRLSTRIDASDVVQDVGQSRLEEINASNFTSVSSVLSTHSADELAVGMVSGVFQTGETSPSSSVSTKEFPASESNTSRDASKTLTIQESGRTYWNSIARIGEDVALALHYAADEGVLHRDIKPANLLLDLQGKIWVTDFGLETELAGDGLTQTGDIIGKLRYMALERFRGVSSPLVDVYSLGAKLYEMVTLQPLFGHLPREQMLQATSTVSPKRPRSIDPSIPQDLETIVRKAISKEPNDRYESAKQLAQDLRYFLENRPIHARKLRPVDQVCRAVPTAS